MITFQDCCNFLADEGGVVSFARSPDTPLARFTIRAGDGDADGPLLAAIQYDPKEECDLLAKAFIPACDELRSALIRRRLSNV